jgi:putative transposase
MAIASTGTTEEGGLLGKRQRFYKTIAGDKIKTLDHNHGQKPKPFWSQELADNINKWSLRAPHSFKDVSASKQSWFTFKKMKHLQYSKVSSDILHKDIIDMKSRGVIKKSKQSYKKKKLGDDNIEEPEPLKSRKIRVYPSTSDKEILRKWFGTARWTYNQCLDSVQRKMCGLTKKELRAKFVNNCNFITENQWVIETPYEVRDAAMGDLIKNYASNFAKNKKNNVTSKFELKFRSRKDKQESVYIRWRDWGKRSGAYAFLANMKTSEPISVLKFDSRITRTKLGHYYLCTPVPIERRDENQVPFTNKIVALDPGVRKFMTTYDTMGTVTFWGVGDIKRIERLCWYYDDLQSRWSSPDITHKKRYKLKKAGLRIQLKIRNLIDDLHKKIAKWLCENYQVILLPKFESQQMVSKLRSKTARAMLTLSHYRFQQRLLFKVQEYPGVIVEIVDEAYTSKTCSKCGCINQKLGGSEVFKCNQCDYRIDRDINGARNILLRYLVLVVIAFYSLKGKT